MLRRVIFTDPAFVKTAAERAILLRDGTPSTIDRIGAYLPVSITKYLWDYLGQDGLCLERPSSFSDERVIQIGDIANYNTLCYLGSHFSDTGMTCMLGDTIEEDLDWTEWMLYTMDRCKVNTAPDDYPEFRMWARIPEADRLVAIFGSPCKDDPQVMSALLLRSHFEANK